MCIIFKCLDVLPPDIYFLKEESYTIDHIAEEPDSGFQYGNGVNGDLEDQPHRSTAFSGQLHDDNFPSPTTIHSTIHEKSYEEGVPSPNLSGMQHSRVHFNTQERHQQLHDYNYLQNVPHNFQPTSEGQKKDPQNMPKNFPHSSKDWREDSQNIPHNFIHGSEDQKEDPQNVTHNFQHNHEYQKEDPQNILQNIQHSSEDQKEDLQIVPQNIQHNSEDQKEEMQNVLDNFPHSTEDGEDQPPSKLPLAHTNSDGQYHHQAVDLSEQREEDTFSHENLEEHFDYYQLHNGHVYQAHDGAIPSHQQNTDIPNEVHKWREQQRENQPLPSSTLTESDIDQSQIFGMDYSVTDVTREQYKTPFPLESSEYTAFDETILMSKDVNPSSPHMSQHVQNNYGLPPLETSRTEDSTTEDSTTVDHEQMHTEMQTFSTDGFTEFVSEQSEFDFHSESLIPQESDVFQDQQMHQSHIHVSHTQDLANSEQHSSCLHMQANPDSSPLSTQLQYTPYPQEQYRDMPYSQEEPHHQAHPEELSQQDTSYLQEEPQQKDESLQSLELLQDNPTAHVQQQEIHSNYYEEQPQQDVSHSPGSTHYHEQPQTQKQFQQDTLYSEEPHLNLHSPEQLHQNVLHSEEELLEQDLKHNQPQQNLLSQNSSENLPEPNSHLPYSNASEEFQQNIDSIHPVHSHTVSQEHFQEETNVGDSPTEHPVYNTDFIESDLDINKYDNDLDYDHDYIYNGEDYEYDDLEGQQIEEDEQEDTQLDRNENPSQAVTSESFNDARTTVQEDKSIEGITEEPSYYDPEPYDQLKFPDHSFDTTLQKESEHSASWHQQDFLNVDSIRQRFQQTKTDIHHRSTDEIVPSNPSHADRANSEFSNQEEFVTEGSNLHYFTDNVEEDYDDVVTSTSDFPHVESVVYHNSPSPTLPSNTHSHIPPEVPYEKSVQDSEVVAHTNEGKCMQYNYDK